MSTIIGGMFGLEFSLPGQAKEKPRPPEFLSGKVLLTVNARSALYLLIQALKPRQVWLPSYLCRAVVDAVAKLPQVKLRYYAMDNCLNLLNDAWIADVHEGDALVAIDYFGFPYVPQLAWVAQNRGAWLIEDASQALLSSHTTQKSDFAIYSPRKTLGVPDGGILKATKQWDQSASALKAPPGTWWLEALQACVLRAEFDRGSGNRAWFGLFRSSEQKAPIGPYAMSELSQILLSHAFDYPAISQRRIHNYQYLSQALSNLLLFPSLTAGTVPIGCPIAHPRRDALRQALFAADIYPPVHWEIESSVPTSFLHSRSLSQSILTLPCDQRYNLEDMERMAAIILQELRKI